MCYKDYATWEEVQPGEIKMCVQPSHVKNLSMHVAGVFSKSRLGPCSSAVHL